MLVTAHAVENLPPPTQPTEKFHRKRYTITEKIDVINQVNALRQIGGTLNEFCRDLGLNISMVRRWISCEELLRRSEIKLPAGSKRVGTVGGRGGRTFHDDEIENHILTFVAEKRLEGHRVSVNSIALEWERQFPSSVENTSRHGIRQRIYRILKRNQLTLRRTTHHAQNTRHHEHIIVDFQKYTRGKAKLFAIPDDAIANFDETNFMFGPTTACTIDFRGTRTVSCKKPLSTSRLTAMLGCTKTGYLFPPFLIFQGKSMVVTIFFFRNSHIFSGADTRGGRIRKELEKADGYPDGMHYHCNGKAWMTEAMMLVWVDAVWKPFAKQHPVSMLILDAHTSHMTRSVRQAIEDCGTILEYIPGGYTSKLQVMDVGLNKPLKDRFRDQVDDFLLTQPEGTKPRRRDVAWWIKESWDSLTHSTIENTWNKVW